MGKLYKLVEDFRNGNIDNFIFIVEEFQPQLNKFQRNSDYEDMKSELILFMFNLLEKIPLEKDIFKEDKYMVSYISKALKHHYIHLNKTNCKILNKKFLLEDKYINNGEEDCLSEIIFKDIISMLSEKEKDLIIKKYKFNYSEAEIARIKGVSRQAIHKTHVRALSKLKKLLE